MIGVAAWFASDWGYWHRYFTRPANMMEPPDEFYRPAAVVKGAPTPFYRLASPGERTVRDDALEAAAKWAEAHSSTALLVWRDGMLQYERYWRGLTGDRLFTGRSMSKTLAPLLIGYAVADGRIASVDDPLSKYLPEWANDDRGRITLKQLMHNVAGLEEPPIDSSPFNLGMRLTLATDFTKVALSFEAVAPPGTRFAINNVNSQLLGMVLERATGVPFEQYLSEKLWAPIGAGDGELYMDREDGMPATYCCYRATPRDWLRLGAALAADGMVGDRRVIPSRWLSEMRVGSSVNPYYGYSLWLGAPRDGIRRYSQDSKSEIRQAEPFASDDLYFLEGGGFRTLWIVPSQRLAILRLGYTVKDWDTAAIPNTILRGLK